RCAASRRSPWRTSWPTIPSATAWPSWSGTSPSMNQGSTSSSTRTAGPTSPGAAPTASGPPTCLGSPSPDASRRLDEHHADPPGGDGDEAELPRLVARHPLSFPVSLLLALLRKRLAEFDAESSDPRLVLSRDQIVEMLRLFLADAGNEARVVDLVDTHISTVM